MVYVNEFTGIYYDADDYEAARESVLEYMDDEDLRNVLYEYVSKHTQKLIEGLTTTKGEALYYEILAEAERRFLSEFLVEVYDEEEEDETNENF